MTGTSRIAIVALIALPACVSAPASTPMNVAGCWYFERDEHAVALNLPWGVHLHPEALPDAPADENAREAETLTGDAVTTFPFGYWAPIAGDSIMIGYPAGGGLVLRLAGGDTSMHGIARPVGDALIPGQTRTDRPVHLTRAQCVEPSDG